VAAANRCEACGLPFLHGEMVTLRPDGTAVHEATQPDSMLRCRDALLAKLATLRVALVAHVEGGRGEMTAPHDCPACGGVHDPNLNAEWR